jgi:hypothetical protein
MPEGRGFRSLKILMKKIGNIYNVDHTIFKEVYMLFRKSHTGKILALFLFVFAVLPLHDAHSAAVKGDAMKILFISETHGLGGDNVTWKSSYNFMPQNINVAYQLGSLGLTQTTFASASQALNAVNNSLALKLGPYVIAMASYLKDNGYNNGRFDWYYSFTDAGDNNKQKKAYLPLIIYPDGNIRNIGARVIVSTPEILYYVYRSKGTEDNLPANWSYPDGGVLYKYVLDQNYNIISSSAADMNGRYDPMAAPEGDATFNPNAGLEMLIKEIAVPDMKNTGALFSIVDYARRVAPVYDCDEQGNCTARVSVRSDVRRYYPDVSGGCYTTKGAIGYTLSYQSERYFVEPSGSYALTATSTGAAIAQPREFAKTVPVGFTPDFYQIIDPFNTYNLYRFDKDTVNNLTCDRYVYAGQMCRQSPVEVKDCTPNCARPYDSGHIGEGSCKSAGLGFDSLDNANCTTAEGLPGGGVYCENGYKIVYRCPHVTEECYSDWEYVRQCYGTCDPSPPLISHTICATAGSPLTVYTHQYLISGRNTCYAFHFIAIRDSAGRVVATRDGRTAKGCGDHWNSLVYTPPVSGNYTIQIWMWNSTGHGGSFCQGVIKTAAGLSCSTGNHFLQCN